MPVGKRPKPFLVFPMGIALPVPSEVRVPALPGNSGTILSLGVKYMVNVRWSLLLLLGGTLAVSFPWATSAAGSGPVPAYNAGPLAKGTMLPPILDQHQLLADDAAYPYQTHAYELAAKIPLVFAPATVLLLLRPDGPQKPAHLF